MQPLNIKDLHENLILDFGAVTLNDEEIKQFALQYDPMPFHIDKEVAKNPVIVWNEAAIKGDEVQYLLETGHQILNLLYTKRTGKTRDLPDYDGSDVANIIRSYKKCYPNVPIFIETNNEKLSA